MDSSAIGRWTKEWLDVGSYCTHSTRGAGVSHAADAGIAVDSVLKSVARTGPASHLLPDLPEDEG